MNREESVNLILQMRKISPRAVKCALKGYPGNEYKKWDERWSPDSGIRTIVAIPVSF